MFSCPEVRPEGVFVDEAFEKETKHVRDEFPCPGCKASLTKKRLERFYESRFDAVLGESIKAPKRTPVIINYSVGESTFEKAPDADDLALIVNVAALALPAEVHSQKLPYMHMTHERARLDDAQRPTLDLLDGVGLVPGTDRDGGPAPPPTRGLFARRKRHGL